ncbi:methyl-accepting chemotaxis protein [Agrobacterium sp. 22-221-1]|uniref:methyl-accepting chemotaxis protein n=1 Tax=Agrobacterium leguminum TaxID=2792015 RepID=UPI003CE54083
MNTFTRERIDAARETVIRYAVLTMCIILGILALSTVAHNQITHAIAELRERMFSFANGDAASPVEMQDRGDVIGDMARSVEFFRQSALRSAQLETAAQEARHRAELERAEMQALAERETGERLDLATAALATGLNRLADGNMLFELDEPFATQFEGLRHDFNRSIRKLRQAFAEAGSVVIGVTAGAHEVSEAAEKLARRSQRQAVALEETAAALEQLTVNVAATSQRTIEIRDLTRETNEGAIWAAEGMGVAIDAMQRIEHGAEQMNEIIGVIDGIAFQINLLALNAGVEAARAGEAGKGFAVVAGEVRELAQRCASSARQIKNLIGKSETAVGKGVHLVKATGSELAGIVETIKVVNNHMAAMTIAAHEQSGALDQINGAIGNIGHVAQENASIGESMASAGQRLALDSRKLDHAFSRFQTSSVSCGELQSASVGP